MSNYVDGFFLPIPRNHLSEYTQVAEKVAEIWKEHGALAYFECVDDDLKMEGIRSFMEAANAKEDEAIIFGWVLFDSRETRDQANQKVITDPRMTDLVGPLTDSSRLIFDASRMVYGGFETLVSSSK